MSRIFAYCRISTLDQTTENQRREIESAGFKIKPQQIIEEHISGSAATSERPGFNRLLARLKCGDQLIVTKLDRLGCNAMDIRKTVEQLTETGIRVHCLASVSYTHLDVYKRQVERAMTQHLQEISESVRQIRQENSDWFSEE